MDKKTIMLVGVASIAIYNLGSMVAEAVMTRVMDSKLTKEREAIMSNKE